MALTPAQHNALAAYCHTGDGRAAAAEVGITYQTFKNVMQAIHDRTDSAPSTINALWRRGWLIVPASQAEPAVVSANVARLRVEVRDLATDVNALLDAMSARPSACVPGGLAPADGGRDYSDPTDEGA